MYAIHADFLYIDFLRTVLKSTIRIFKYGKQYVQNDWFLKPGSIRNPELHSYQSISWFYHVLTRYSGKPGIPISYFGCLRVHG